MDHFRALVVSKKFTNGSKSDSQKLLPMLLLNILFQFCKLFISDPDMLCMLIEALLYVNKTKWIDKKVNCIWHSPYSKNFVQ